VVAGNGVAVTLVTLSASYGAGGSRVAPELAQRLEVPLLDRVISVAVAERLAVSVDEGLAAEESIGSVLHRLTFGVAAAGVIWGGPANTVIDEAAYRSETERVIWELAVAGSGVILGRAAAIVLRNDPRALHVRLDGPAARRIAQAMAAEGIDPQTAERRLAKTDRAREAYVGRLYRADPRDSGLYHLVIDSTVIPLEACVELIVDAARARTAASAAAGDGK
jgi:cytidylate kinase